MIDDFNFRADLEKALPYGELDWDQVYDTAVRVANSRENEFRGRIHLLQAALDVTLQASRDIPVYEFRKSSTVYACGHGVYNLRRKGKPGYLTTFIANGPQEAQEFVDRLNTAIYHDFRGGS
jgi:hypothetical protein